MKIKKILFEDKKYKIPRRFIAGCLVLLIPILLFVPLCNLIAWMATLPLWIIIAANVILWGFVSVVIHDITEWQE